MSCEVEPCPIVVAGGFDDQRVALPSTDRISHPGRVGILRQRTSVEKHLTRRRTFVHDDEHVFRLNELGRQLHPEQACARTWWQAVGVGAVLREAIDRFAYTSRAHGSISTGWVPKMLAA